MGLKTRAKCRNRCVLGLMYTEGKQGHLLCLCTH